MVSLNDRKVFLRLPRKRPGGRTGRATRPRFWHDLIHESDFVPIRRAHCQWARLWEKAKPPTPNGEHTVRIEEVTGEHLDTVAELFDAYRQFYEQPSDPPAARRFLGERLENGDAHLICAVADDGIAGFAQLFPTLDSIALARSWILHDLYVAPAFRRRGVARMLLREARELGIRTGASLLTISTGIGNKSAQALYEDEGWERDAEYYFYDLHLPQA